MITPSNFMDVLKILDFKSDICESVFTYDFENYKLEADFTNKKLIYPVEIRGRERNDSFNVNENFVVFECVFRLLQKGYRPEDIELEKVWTLGHEKKSGRADICVYDKDNSEKVLIIIECKTWGKEFDKALNDTKQDGGQLFSYWQQESSTKWLVLYSSDVKDGKIEYKSPTINCSDDKNLILQSENDEDIKLYFKADTAEKKFSAWKETYKHEIHDDIIFSNDTIAYDIGLKPLRKKDLKSFSDDNNIVNLFEEILRHNNVSDKENAFNRLIALFICKLVDEIKKSENDETDFQYKQRIDDYEMLQDRLQHLYTQGMKEFMREKISYVPSDYPENLFRKYTKQNRNEAIADLKRTFRILKYYSNNDFAFKDVHNEELFYQNGKILVEVVQLFQKYKIVHTENNQLLGNLFEKLLNKGFKQNEGQFFTPLPITRFIWDSLPLRKFETWPKIIDYACGAGHFLTEAVSAVNYFIDDPQKNNSWTRNCIFGIEKDYRLARVSKVSLFMNGAGDGNIIFGDGLENNSQIEPETFDILTANPPFSVASFKGHLKIKNNKFNLLDKISFNGSEIEVLFVERISQLLKSGGIAAVILPSSILSNESASYIGAREEILKNFMLRSIVKLGGKTFGATNTETVIIFLEKYKDYPKECALMKDCVNAIFDGRNLDGWEDKNILESYLENQGINNEEWRKFITEEIDINLDDDKLPEYFRMYFETFKNKSENKNLDPDSLNKKFYFWVKKIECEKIYYYGLTHTQKTVVILAPSDKDKSGRKEFLGYDWSQRKGAEGIQYSIRGGKLYDDKNREAEGTLAHVVRQSFYSNEIILTEDNRKYTNIFRTCDMLDFSRVNFGKNIRLSGKKNFEMISKYPKERLDSICRINIPKSETKNFSQDTLASFIEMSSVNNNGEIISMTERPIGELKEGSYVFFEEGDILVAKMMSNSENFKCTIAVGLENKIGFGSSEFYVFRCDEKIILTKFLFEYLMQTAVRKSAWKSVTGSGRLRVPSYFYESMMIPLPPMEIQQQIVNECEKIDEEYNRIHMTIEECRKKIYLVFNEILTTVHAETLRLDDKKSFSLTIGKRVLNSELIEGGEIPVYSANVFEPFGYVNKLLDGFEDFSKDSVLWGIDGDFMVNFVAKGQKFYPTDHCGVLRVLTDKVHPRYIAMILEREGKSMNFSRSYRASLERVRGIKFEVPDIEKQNLAMNEVLKLEAQISNAQQQLKNLQGKKEVILKQYLQ
ncbi:MAG: N-6 DNA methylase [Synergistaceae bacterium]|nr:N-6 DNA methylase [Synergistaceae bacterium]